MGEFLSMWNVMMVGETPFTLDESGALQLALRPVITSWMWSDDGKVSFTFLGSIAVTYHNAAKSNTYGDDAPKIKQIFLQPADASHTMITISGPTVAGHYAEMVRQKRVTDIDVFF